LRRGITRSVPTGSASSRGSSDGRFGSELCNSGQRGNMSYPEGISRNRAANVEMSRYQAKMAGLSGDVVVDKRKQQQQEEEGPPQPKKMSLNWLCKFFMEGGSAACRNGANVSPHRHCAAGRARTVAGACNCGTVCGTPPLSTDPLCCLAECPDAHAWRLAQCPYSHDPTKPVSSATHHQSACPADASVTCARAGLLCECLCDGGAMGEGRARAARES
jgi:hypothetical protein